MQPDAMQSFTELKEKTLSVRHGLASKSCSRSFQHEQSANVVNSVCNSLDILVLIGSRSRMDWQSKSGPMTISLRIYKFSLQQDHRLAQPAEETLAT